MPETVRVEKGSGHSLLVCSCGWREMVFTEAGLRDAVRAHKTLVHDDPKAAATYVAQRRYLAGGR